MNALTQPVSLLRSYASFGEKGEKYVVTITKKSCEKENDNDLFNLLFSESDEDVTKILSDDEGLD